MTRNGRHRAYWLIAIVSLATFAVACGRATEADINAALGITPTPTMSTDDIATATAEAAANATRVAEGGEDAAAQDTTNLASLGNAMIGRTTFLSNCTGCHVANGSGVAPPLPGANGLAAPLTDTQLYNTIRDGANHGADIGGPGAKANLTDKQIYDMIAFIRAQP
ncbi:MAG: cytochrome c [Thermomicrobiales bacterium]|nr:cytochrome c [Thermomicrobiales bacterium]